MRTYTLSDYAEGLDVSPLFAAFVDENNPYIDRKKPKDFE